MICITHIINLAMVDGLKENIVSIKKVEKQGNMWGNLLLGCKNSNHVVKWGIQN